MASILIIPACTIIVMGTVAWLCWLRWRVS
jgi:hypothetical protein